MTRTNYLYASCELARIYANAGQFSEADAELNRIDRWAKFPSEKRRVSAQREYVSLKAKRK